MLTVSNLAKAYNLSRTTILYYEKAGLLLPASRSSNGYRWYGKKEQRRLETIINYRSFGISINQIEKILASSKDSQQNKILKQRFDYLEVEIGKLRQQQHAIIQYLEDPGNIVNQKMTKETWTSIMKTAGFTDEDMTNWHKTFETMQPEAHQLFLESLQLSKKEVLQLRRKFKA